MIRTKKEEDAEIYDDDDDEDEDLSKYWSDYDTFGYDKRGLGSMKRSPLGRRISNQKFMK